MLDSLKQAGMAVGRELSRAWEGLSEGTRLSEAHSKNAVLSVRVAKRDTRTATPFPV